VIESRSRRCCSKWLREDVAAETRCRVLQSLARGTVVESLRGYAIAVMRSVISDLLAQERPKEADVDKVPEVLASATYDELVV